MKKTHSYEIDHIHNSVTVTKRFLENATQIDSQEFALIERFKQFGLTLQVQERAPRKSPRTVNENYITYKKMRQYISCLDEKEDLLQYFEKAREDSKSQKNPYSFMLKWFHTMFPNYQELPEFNDDFSIVYNPNSANAI